MVSYSGVNGNSNTNEGKTMTEDTTPMIYMTGVSNDYTRRAARTTLKGHLGVLLGPATAGGPDSKCARDDFCDE